MFLFVIPPAVSLSTGGLGEGVASQRLTTFLSALGVTTAALAASVNPPTTQRSSRIYDTALTHDFL